MRNHPPYRNLVAHRMGYGAVSRVRNYSRHDHRRELSCRPRLGRLRQYNGRCRRETGGGRCYSDFTLPVSASAQTPCTALRLSSLDRDDDPTWSKPAGPERVDASNGARASGAAGRGFAATVPAVAAKALFKRSRRVQRDIEFLRASIVRHSLQWFRRPRNWMRLRPETRSPWRIPSACPGGRVVLWPRNFEASQASKI